MRCELIERNARSEPQSNIAEAQINTKARVAKACLERFYAKFIDITVVINVCEWRYLAVLVQPLFDAHKRMPIYIEDLGCGVVKLPDEVHTAANRFMELAAHVRFDSGHFMNFISRMDDKKQQSQALKKRIPRSTSIIDKMFGELAACRLDCGTRTSVLKELYVCCEVLTSKQSGCIKDVVGAPGIEIPLSSNFSKAGLIHEQHLKRRNLTTTRCDHPIRSSSADIQPGLDDSMDDLFEEESQVNINNIDFGRAELGHLQRQIIGGTALGKSIVDQCLVKQIDTVAAAFSATITIALSLSAYQTPVFEDATAEPDDAMTLALKCISKQSFDEGVSLIDYASQSHPNMLKQQLQSLPTHKARDMAYRILEMNFVNDYRQWTFLFPCAPEGHVTRERCIAACDVYCEVTQALQLLSWLCDKLRKDKKWFVTATSLPSGLVHYDINAHGVEIITHLKAVFGEEEKMIISVEVDGAVEDTNMLQVLNSKLQTFTGIMVAKLVQDVSQIFNDRLKALNQSTQELTSKWKLYIDDSKFDRQLAKQQLGTRELREHLGEQVELHHSFVTDMASAFAEWGMPKPTEMAVVTATTCESYELLRYAQETIAVSAAINILENAPAANCVTQYA